MKAPSTDDLFIASQWLDIYDGAEDAEACHRVSAWLRQQAEAKEQRELAKENGVSVKHMRNLLEKVQK